MADLTKTIDILFGGKNNLGPVISGVKRSLNDLDGYAQNIAQPLASVANAILGIDAALGAMAVGGMALALRESEKFGDGFAEISTLLHGSEQDIQGFRDAVKDYAQQSSQSIEDIQAATYSAISAGVDMKDSLDVLRKAEELAVAGRAQLADTTTLLAGTLNAYGEEMDQAERYSDVFFKTVERGQTTIPELASGLSRVTSLAGNAGIDIETLSAAVATLTAKNIQTSEAVSGLKAAISNIIKPTADAQKTAQELGIQFDATALKTKGLESLLLDVARATQGDTEAMSKLFGSVEGLNAVLALTSGNGEMFVENLEAMQKAAGSTSTAYEKMAENMSLVNQNLANNMRVTLAGIGERLEDAYSDTAGNLVGILQGVAEGVDAGVFDPLFDAIDNFAARAGDFLEDVAENLPEALEGIDWSGFLDALGDLGDTLATLFDGVDLRTPEGLEEAMQGVVDTLESLTRVTEGMVEYFKPLWDAIKEGIDRFNGLDEATKKSSGNIAAVAQAVVAAGAAIGVALVAIVESGAKIEDVFNAVVGSIKWLWNSLQQAFDVVALAVTEGLRRIVQAAEYVTRLPGFEEWNEELKELESNLEHTGKAISMHMGEQAAQAADAAAQAMDGFTGKAAEAARAAEDTGQKAADSWGKIADSANITVSAVGDNAEEIKRILTQKMSEAEQGVSDDLAAISDEIEAAIPKEKSMVVQTFVAPDALKKTKEDIEEVAKAAEEVNELALARMEAATARYTALMEANTKKAIAEIEASAGVSEAALQSSGSVLGDYGEVYEALRAEGKSTYHIRRFMEEEVSNRQQLMEAQRKQVEAQTAYMEARTDRMESGEGEVIKIEAAGLEPHIEAFMVEILKRVQVWASEQSSAFLLGLT